MNDDVDLEPSAKSLVPLTTRMVAVYVRNNLVPQDDLAQLIASTHKALHDLAAPPATPQIPTAAFPAVSIRKSVTLDFIFCLEDGKKFKTLRRHLSALGMTPDQYRTKWGLPADYPMVAPNYARQRAALAKSSGLGKGSRVVSKD